MNRHSANWNGQVFHRNSKGRIYTHCVIARPSYEAALRFARADDAGDVRTYWYYRSATPYSHDFIGGDRVQVGDDVYFSPTEFEADFPTPESYQDYLRDVRIAEVERRREEGEFDNFIALAWTGRRDLAAKRYDQESKRSWAEVIVLKAEVL